jgi:hypothetical protein
MLPSDPPLAFFISIFIFCYIIINHPHSPSSAYFYSHISQYLKQKVMRITHVARRLILAQELKRMDQRHRAPWVE